MNPFEPCKLFKHLDRVAVWQTGGVPPPVTMEFDLTGRCNHHCPKCCGGYRGGDMPVDDARSWLSQMAAYGVRGIMFTGGGEPLLHAAAVDLIEYAAERGMAVGLITNGTALTAPQADRLVEICQWIRVSIDAGDAEAYRLTHGMGSEDFARAWDAVAMLTQARDHWGAKCTIGVGYLLSDVTAPGVWPALDRASEIAADYLQLRPFLGEAVPLPEAILERVGSHVGRCRLVCSEAKYRAMGQPRTYSVCHGAWFTGVVQADGAMPLCCHLRGNPAAYFGDLRRQSFRAAWESAEHAAMIARWNVAGCVPLCRNHGNSTWLDSCLRPVTHEAFV